MTHRTGFYPGSFDPVTNGHLDVIERACRLVDRLVVALGVHHEKAPLTTPEERLELLRVTAGPIADRNNTKLELTTFKGLLVNSAREHGADLIIRGLRDTTDYNYEMQMVGMNAQMDPNQQTVFVPASPHVRHISATLVRQIARMGGDISAFSPAAVVKLLSEK